jgi:hypothetical protein
MSDDNASSPDSPQTPPAAKRARKATTPRAKKSAATEAANEASAPVTAPVEVIASIPFPTSKPKPQEDRRERRPDPRDDEARGSQVNDWPDSETTSEGGSSASSEQAKRKRRRRKGKGGQAHGQSQQASGNDFAPEEVTHSLVSSDAPQPDAQPGPRPQGGPAPQQHRVKIDPALLTKMAWKIYLAEVSEEGVALIGDTDAKELSRRCFRLAEIFIEEQSRRR